MNSYNKDSVITHPSHNDEVNISVVAEVIGASETDEQIPNQLPAPPVKLFTTTIGNVSELLMEDIITEAGTLYSVGAEKVFLNLGGISRQWQ